MNEYLLPIVNETADHSGNIYAFAFAYLLFSIMIFVIANKTFKDKNKLYNFSRSLVVVSTGVFIVSLIAGTFSNYHYTANYSKQVSDLQNQIIENNPEIKNISFMKGGNPAPDISPNGPSPKHSKIFECYIDSQENSEDRGFIRKADNTVYHATIQRISVDNNEQTCKYSLTIGEKIEPRYDDDRSLDGLRY